MIHRSNNMVRTFCHRLMPLAVAITFIGLFAAPVGAQARPQPSNRVVIMIDGSGSYKARRNEAIEQSISLLDTLARTRLRRWEHGTDTIVVISLDAIPEVLWKGTLEELKAVGPAAWTARFRARRDYTRCTAIGPGFRLAARYLEGNSRFVKKYLIVFSDLIDEPPVESLRKSAPPNPYPPRDFPWETLRDVSVSVFWVPPDQKLIWRRAAEEHDMISTFALYTTSESAEVMITPPPRPTIERTEEERQTARIRYEGYVWTLGKWAGGVIALLVLLSAAAMLVSRRRSRVVTAQTPTSGGMRPVRNGSRNLPRPPVPPRNR